MLFINVPLEICFTSENRTEMKSPFSTWSVAMALFYWGIITQN
jgi:hypothetical protein